MSSVPSPCSRSGLSGSSPARFTASMYSGVCTVRSSASSATGAGTTSSRSSTPSARASRIVRSTRIGLIGWPRPKSYAVSSSSNTSIASPLMLPTLARVAATGLLLANVKWSTSEVEMVAVAAACQRITGRPPLRAPKGRPHACPDQGCPGRRGGDRTDPQRQPAAIQPRAGRGCRSADRGGRARRTADAGDADQDHAARRLEHRRRRTRPWATAPISGSCYRPPPSGRFRRLGSSERLAALGDQDHEGHGGWTIQGIHDQRDRLAQTTSRTSSRCRSAPMTCTTTTPRASRRAGCPPCSTGSARTRRPPRSS